MARPSDLNSVISSGDRRPSAMPAATSPISATMWSSPMAPRAADEVIARLIARGLAPIDEERARRTASLSSSRFAGLGRADGVDVRRRPATAPRPRRRRGGDGADDVGALDRGKGIGSGLDSRPAVGRIGHEGIQPFAVRAPRPYPA